MPSNPAFDLFEEICMELSGKEESILVDDDFSPETLEAVKQWFHEPAAFPAVSKALSYLQKHFGDRGSNLPFDYNPDNGHAMTLDKDYIDFVADAQDKRSDPKESRDFEMATSAHMAKKLTGIVRRVGSPRRKHTKRKEFANYLAKEFGFRKDVLKGNDKDGGFDILWFPPLGAFPFRALVSIQCKNSYYNRAEGFKSVGRAKQSLKRHSHSTADEGHLHCVVYNDYIDETILDNARDAGFVPLGLSDLAPLTNPMHFEQL